MLLNNATKLLPSCGSLSDLANRFAEFFVEKIEKIRRNLNVEIDLGGSHDVVVLEQSIGSSMCCSSEDKTVSDELSVQSDSVNKVVCVESDATELHELKPVSLEEIDRILKKCSNKLCLLDPIPMWLLKDNSTQFIPILTEIVNASFKTGNFPDALKDAIITPIIKKQNMDPNILSNYRPVSNIKVVAKVAEMAASARLTDHLNSNNLNEIFQSAYRPCHSTETALLRVKNDIATAIDNTKAVFLVMLDLSAAFDTIDHSIFINRLHHTFHIKGRALKWFASYLQNRKNRVSISGKFSQEQVLNFGLPQGSILGPRGYTMYTHPVGEILRRNNVDFHTYADDTQIYVVFDPRNDAECELALNRLKTCVHEIKTWMTKNMLQLNQAKTEFFIAASSRFIGRLSHITFTVDNVTIKPALALKNLGVTFDPVLNMSRQISSIVKCVSFHLRNLSRIRRFMDYDTAKLAVQALVFSRIDYCNALLLGATEYDLTRLQRLQNRAARLIFLVGRDTPSAPLLRRLHWLPIRKRIEFKILTIVYKCVYAQAPEYLQNLITLNKPTYRVSQKYCTSGKKSPNFENQIFTSQESYTY